MVPYNPFDFSELPLCISPVLWNSTLVSYMAPIISARHRATRGFLPSSSPLWDDCRKEGQDRPVLSDHHCSGGVDPDQHTRCLSNHDEPAHIKIRCAEKTARAHRLCHCCPGARGWTRFGKRAGDPSPLACFHACAHSRHGSFPGDEGTLPGSVPLFFVGYFCFLVFIVLHYFRLSSYALLIFLCIFDLLIPVQSYNPVIMNKSRSRRLRP